MSSACLVFTLYLNQISHLTMLSTSHLMTKRTRNQTKFRYIIVPYGHVLVTSRVTFRLWSLLIFRNLLLFIHTSIHFSLFLLFFYYFLWFPNLFVFSPRLFLTLKIFLSFLSPPHWIIMTQYVFQYLLSLVYHAKTSRSLWMLIFVRVISKSQFTIGFFKSSSLEDPLKKEHDNEKLHPPNLERIEQLFERIIHCVTVWRLSNWEWVLHVYLFLAEFL